MKHSFFLAFFLISINFAFAQSKTGITWNSAEFSLEGSKFYIDEFTETPLLAIVPDDSTKRPVSASVSKTFSGEKGNYTITFYGVGESDGQSEFKIYVNQKQLEEAIILPLSSKPWEMGAAFNRRLKHVNLTKGDVITIEGKTASADGQEWSRARWWKIVFTQI